MSTSVDHLPNWLFSKPECWPQELAILTAMLVELRDLVKFQQNELKKKDDRIQWLERQLFGKKSERVTAGSSAQPYLFDMTPDPIDPATIPPLPEPEADAKPCKRGQNYHKHKHGRGVLPPHLPRKVYERTLNETERACTCCGQLRISIGTEVSEYLEHQPASNYVVQEIQHKYACPSCEHRRLHPETADSEPVAVTPPPPPPPPENPPATTTSAERPVVHPEDVAVAPGTTWCLAPKPLLPLWKALAGPGLLAHVLVSKYVDHLPLYRQSKIFKREGVELSDSTLCDWVTGCAELLEPLYQLLCDEVRQSKVIHTDDTGVRVQDRAGKGFLWVYVGDRVHPYVIYRYSTMRDGVDVDSYLKNYTGYLQADAYSVYEAIYASGRVEEVACWAHARRKFFEAREQEPLLASYVLGMVRRLYKIEREATETGQQQKLTAEEFERVRWEKRQQEAVPLLTVLLDFLKQRQPELLPKSKITEAVNYVLNREESFLRYTTNGRLSIDNNVGEGHLRNVVIGRKNYLFFGSDAGGRRAAIIYSIVQSCIRIKVEPWLYLKSVLEEIARCASGNEAVNWQAWLPDRWAERQRAAANAEAQATT